MNPSPRELVPAIVSYVTNRGGYVTKTKLLKLLYLCDVEYYRVFRSQITDFNWKFFHLGPWAREFDPLLDELVAHGVLIESADSRPEFETKFFTTPEPVDLDKIFSTYREEAPVKHTLDRWAESSTGEILDYVYFHTEPMEQGIRSQPLDFAAISSEPVMAYTRQASGKTHREIRAARREFRERVARRKAEGTRGFAFTSPRYDKDFFEALTKLDESAS